MAGFPVLRWHQTADVGAVPNQALPKVFMAVGQPFFARQSTLLVDLWFFMAACSCEKLRSITRYCLDKQTSARHPSWLNHPCILTSDHLIERASFALMTLFLLAGGHRHKRPRAAPSLHSGEVDCSVKNWIMYIFDKHCIGRDLKMVATTWLELMEF